MSLHKDFTILLLLQVSCLVVAPLALKLGPKEFTLLVASDLLLIVLVV